MCKRKTDAMNMSDITKTGTGPLWCKQNMRTLKRQGKTSYWYIHFDPWWIVSIELPHSTTAGASCTWTGRSRGAASRLPANANGSLLRYLQVLWAMLKTHLCLTVLPAPALGAIGFGERLPAPTVVALAGADGWSNQSKEEQFMEIQTQLAKKRKQNIKQQQYHFLISFR